MKSEALIKNTINNIKSDLLGFSHALIGDIELGQKVVSDSIVTLSVKEKELLNRIESFKVHDDQIRSDLNELVLSLKNSIFRIAKTTYVEKVKFDFDSSSFYFLPIEKRACLHLKYRQDMSVDSIAKVLELTNREVLVLLNESRDELLRISKNQ